MTAVDTGVECEASVSAKEPLSRCSESWDTHRSAFRPEAAVSREVLVSRRSWCQGGEPSWGG